LNMFNQTTHAHRNLRPEFVFSAPYPSRNANPPPEFVFPNFTQAAPGITPREFVFSDSLT
jgi:hypothetical protein